MSEFILNRNDMRVWRHRVSKILFAEQPYGWVDRVTIIQEDGDNRTVIDEASAIDIKASNKWLPVTIGEFEKVCKQYKEIYN